MPPKKKIQKVINNGIEYSENNLNGFKPVFFKDNARIHHSIDYIVKKF